MNKTFIKADKECDGCGYRIEDYSRKEIYCTADNCQHLSKVRLIPNVDVEKVEVTREAELKDMVEIEADSGCLACKWLKGRCSKEYCAFSVTTMECAHLDAVKVKHTEINKSLVSHPQHYNKEGHSECWDEMKNLFGVKAVIIFDLLSAYKYYYRAGLKDGNSSEQENAKIEVYMNHAKDLIMKMVANGDRYMMEYAEHYSKMQKLLDERGEEIENSNKEES